MFIELHLLQNFVPANLNRDDTNNPKDCEFGGQRRARISSQCLKRAIRTNDVFANTTKASIAMRTKWMVDLLSRPLLDTGKPAETVTEVVENFVTQHFSKLDKKKAKKDDEETTGNTKTAVLLFVGPDEINQIANALQRNWDEIVASDKSAEVILKKLSKELENATKNGTSAPDIALFGRMLAEKPSLNIEAACQVAHAISTHRITMEMDYFTAVDDLNPTEETGAGMVGFTGFNSACFYRYARIDWQQLVDNLNDDTDLAARTVQGFIRSAITAVPSGKQNSTAPFNPPSFILAVVRQDGMGWNLANAFETPVRSKFDEGLVGPSLAKLDTYWKRLTEVYGQDTLTGVFALSLDPDLSLHSLKDNQIASLSALIEGINAAIITNGATA